MSIKNSYLGQAWLVLMLALCFGAGLAGMDSAVSERIKQNKINESVSQIPTLVPGATTGQEAEIDGLAVYRAVDAAGGQVGWILPAVGQGFADRIELLIGLDIEAKTIIGLYVLDQKETPGLGNKIVEPVWTGQFSGKPAGGLVVTKTVATSPAEIEAVTGATVSSQSVCTIVNNTVAAFQAKLAGETEVE